MTEDDFDIVVKYIPSDNEYEWIVYDSEGDIFESSTANDKDTAIYRAKRSIEQEIKNNQPEEIVFSTLDNSKLRELGVIEEAEIVESEGDDQVYEEVKKVDPWESDGQKIAAVFKRATKRLNKFVPESFRRR